MDSTDWVSVEVDLGVKILQSNILEMVLENGNDDMYPACGTGDCKSWFGTASLT